MRHKKCQGPGLGLSHTQVSLRSKNSARFSWLQFKKNPPASGREWQNNHLETQPDLSPIRRPALPGKLLWAEPSPQAGGAPARPVSCVLPISDEGRRAREAREALLKTMPPNNSFHPRPNHNVSCHDFSFPIPSRHFDRDAEEWEWVTMEGASGHRLFKKMFPGKSQHQGRRQNEETRESWVFRHLQSQQTVNTAQFLARAI